MSEIVNKVKKSPLMRDLVVSGAFGVVGIIGHSNSDPLLSHLAGVAIGFGFGFAIRSLMLFKPHVAAVSKA